MINKELILKRFIKIEDKLLVSKILDKVAKMQKARVVTYSDFLDPYQKSLVEKAFSGNEEIDLEFNGGFEGAERVIVVFRPTFMLFDEDEFESPFKLVDVSFTNKESLTHRDFLGSLMGLGIKREKIGDILVREDGCGIIVFEDIADYISYNLTKVSNVKVQVSLKDVDEVQVDEPETRVMNRTVASLRLDCMTAAGFGVSRSKISEYIKAERVFLNWDAATNATKPVKEGDTISVRGKGRVIVEEVGKTTKKGRISVVLKKLI